MIKSPSTPPRFRTLPPADVAYRSAQLQALVAEAFAAKQKPHRFPCDCCSTLTVDRSGTDERPLRCMECTEHGCQPFEKPRCLVPREQESDRSALQGQLRSDLAGVTPSPCGASDDAGVLFNTSAEQKP